MREILTAHIDVCQHSFFAPLQTPPEAESEIRAKPATSGAEGSDAFG